MWKDKLKGFIKDVAKEVKDAYEDVKEDVKDANIGEKLKKIGEELKEEFMPEESNGSGQTTSGTASGEAAMTNATNAPTATVSALANTESTEAPKKAPEAPITYEAGDEEVALLVPTEDGARGELTCLNEKTYSYLIPKDPGFSDEGDCHAAEIYQAYGYGEVLNYEHDAMMYYSIAPEFDCEIKESSAKAAYTRYDSAPIRSKLMTVDHPVFTHVYLFETPKKYRLTYLKQIDEYELLGCELILRKSGGDDAWKAKMIEEFKRFAGSCREV